MSASEIASAVRLLLDGKLVAIPTETVYGLAADARNAAAVSEIFRVKGRPADHPLIVHVPGADHLEKWAIDIPAVAWELAEQFWPGPLTLILRRHPSVPDVVTGGQDTVGIRVPGHSLTLTLLREFAASGGSGGIAAPSANRFGRISPTTARHVLDDLGDDVPLVLDGGPCPVGIESTIIDLSRQQPVILRPGVISAEALALVLGMPPVAQDPTLGQAPRVSGALEAHYAPTTPLSLLSGHALAEAVALASSSGKQVAAMSRHRPEGVACRLWIPAPLDPLAYGHDLYANLRQLDRAAVDLILIEVVPGEGDWLAVADRLRRAAVGAGQSS